MTLSPHSLTPPTSRPVSFASDNYAGVHPDVLRAIAEASTGHARAYGDDALTQSASRKIEGLFKGNAKAFFVFNGTGANVLGLQTLLRSHESILCADTAHIHVDECGAPEKFLGSKIIPIATPDGKLTPTLLAPFCKRFGDPHFSQPKVISISQTSEYGTVYTASEVRALADFAHSKKMFLHMDGARIANAVAALSTTIDDLTRNAGVDVLSFGGTKNGILFGEAVVFFRSEHAAEFPFIRKQGMQLASKMRFIGAQFEALLTDDLWLKNARHANQMAKLLEGELAALSEILITRKVEANAVFATLPLKAAERAREKYLFHFWGEPGGSGECSPVECRWMTAFDTKESDIAGFIQALRQALHDQARDTVLSR